MKFINIFPRLFIPLLALALFTLPFLLGAEERGTDSTQVASEVAPAAGYNNTRSNKSIVAAPDITNICDGVTCADGSCAATADECVVAGTISPDIYAESEIQHQRDLDSDGDGTLDVVERGDVTPALYERPKDPEARQVRAREEVDIISLGEEKAVVPNDCNDDDTCVYPGERPQTNNEDETIDDNDVIAPAQDSNSTRSNRRKNVFDGGGSGDNDWPEATLRAGAFIRLGSIEGEATTRGNIDITVVCWGRAEDNEGKIYAWGRGLCVAPEATANAEGVARDRITAIQVSGNEVRNWSEEERSAWQEYQETRATTSREERLAERMVNETLVDERIKEMRADDEGVEVRYQTKLRLFGLIPIEREVSARADIEGNLKIDYPWYRFMSTTPDRERIKSLLLDTVDIVILVPKRAG